jgi:hypothetical protein
LHGIAGNVTFPTTANGMDDCAIADFNTTGVRFVACACYDGLIAASLNKVKSVDCQLMDTLSLLPDSGHEYDVCLVSVSTKNGVASIDLSVPLPAVIGLVTAPCDQPNRAGFNATPFQTYFDTTCSDFSAELPFALPIFP